MITYDINALDNSVEDAGNTVWHIQVKFYTDENKTELLSIGEDGFAETSVSGTEEEVMNYIEKTFIPDLRNNYSIKLGGLILPWEVTEDVTI